MKNPSTDGKSKFNSLRKIKKLARGTYTCHDKICINYIDKMVFSRRGYLLF